MNKLPSNIKKMNNFNTVFNAFDKKELVAIIEHCWKLYRKILG